MKIVNICMNAPFTEGYSYQDNLLTEYQQKLGHEVTIITSTRTRGENGKEIRVSAGEKMLENGVKLVRISSNNKFRAFFGYYPEISSILKKIQPDFVYIHGLCTVVPMQIIDYKRKQNTAEVHIVADNHQDGNNTKLEGFPFKQQVWLFRQLWKRWIKDVDKVYGTTSWRVTFAKEIYGIPENKLDTLVMGIDFAKMPQDRNATRQAIRKELNISDKAFVFTTGGKLDFRKSTIEMMEAFHEIDNPDAVFLIFGSVASDIEQRFDELLQLDQRIKYIGYLSSERIKEYLIAADVGVFAGRHSVLWEEAIGCGLPSLFRKYDERDHVEVNGNCVSLKEPDVKAIKEVMQRVLVDKLYYESMKNAAIEAADNFSYWKIAEKSIECRE